MRDLRLQRGRRAASTQHRHWNAHISASRRGDVFICCQMWAAWCERSCSVLAVRSTVTDPSLIFRVHLRSSAHRLFSQVFVLTLHLQVLHPVP